MIQPLDDKQPPGTHISPGETLVGRYLIQEVIGMGGMSAVYRARDLHFPNMVRLVAVKEMIPNTRDPVVRDNIYKHFEREAHILASLRHPAIPQIYDYFIYENRVYLILEFIQGKDLETLLNESQGPFPEEQVLGWAVELCDVLEYLHSHKPNPVIFRDMKPSNIMINQSGRVVLVDFGIAKIFEGARKGTMIGTEGYAPPEQYRGEASPLVDIYALGATLHHLLTRQDPRLEPPFSFDSRPIRAVNPHVSPEFEAIIMRALAYEPEKRFQSAGEMKEALLAVAHKTGLLQEAMPTAKLIGGLVAGAPKPVWQFQAEDEIRGSPFPHEDKVFVGSYDHNLYALDAGDGALLWKFPTEGGVVTRPVAMKHLILFGSEDHAVYAVHRDTGRVEWTYITQGPVRGSPALAEDILLIGSDDGHLYALHVPTGRIVWRFDAEVAIRSRPLVYNDHLYFGTEGGEIYCLDFQGQVVWRYRAKRAVTAAPAAGDGVIYVPSVDAQLYALDAEAGWLLWRFRMGRGSISSPAVHKGRIYVGSADGHLYCINARNAREMWRFATEHQVSGGVTLFQDKVYFGSVDGKLYCVEAQSGQRIWEYPTEGPITGTPAMAHNMVYIGSHDHRLYALMA